MFGEIAEKLRGRRKVILVHGNADMDAVGSAYALQRAFPEADIFAPNGIDRVTKVVVEKIGIEILEECDLTAYEQVVIVDTSSPEQLEMDQSIPEGAIVIDHHMSTGKWEGYDFYCDSEKTSCCEIIKDILDENGIDIDRNMGLMLIGGMITDSGHFQFARPDMLTAFSDIMTRCGIDMDEAYNLTIMPVSMSEKIAMLKAIERTKFDRVGNLIVATSYGSSFEASSCRAIMAAGADVVFVGSQRDETFRLSTRATQEAVRKGVNLGDIMKGIGEETENDGGGHGGAAGLSGIGDVEAMLFICMKRTMEVFRDIKSRDLLGKED
ncbi:exopolyphosphatase-related protein [methanogenic archaeon mixed culture ISO4-G1]|nr:exopolyphosphatase-related protein [methanogenic archaeon mixed culture ISO4-G1]